MANKEDEKDKETMDVVQRLEGKLDDVIVYRDYISISQFRDELQNIDKEISNVISSSQDPSLYLLLFKVRS